MKQSDIQSRAAAIASCFCSTGPSDDGRPLTTRCEEAIVSLITSALHSAPAPVAPPGYALVPLRMTREMEDVTEEEGWQWESLLEAAGAITEEQHEQIGRDEPVAPPPVGDGVPAAWIPPEREGQYHGSDFINAARTPKAGWEPVYRAAPPAPVAQAAGQVGGELLEPLLRIIEDRAEPHAWKDWACTECHPHSDCLKQGFRCAVHVARAALAGAASQAQPTDDELLACWDRASNIAEAGERRLAFARMVLALQLASPRARTGCADRARPPVDYGFCDGVCDD